MDLERSVKVVLGALLGGGGAVERTYGVEDEVKGNEKPLALRLRALLASPRRPVHPIFPALTCSNSGGAADSHFEGTLFRKLSFFILCSLVLNNGETTVCSNNFQVFSLCAARIPVHSFSVTSLPLPLCPLHNKQHTVNISWAKMSVINGQRMSSILFSGRCPFWNACLELNRFAEKNR